MVLAGFAAPQAGATIVNATLQLSMHAYDNANPTPDGLGDGNDANAATITVGELDDAGVNRLSRGVLDFTLPAIPVGEELQSATLKLYSRIAVTPGTGDVAVYHSRTLDPRSGSNGLYQDTGYNNFAGTIATSSIGGSDAAPALASLNVTSWVTSDYLNDVGSFASSFRLQIDGLTFVEDNVRHLYSFVGKGATTLSAYIPVLELQFAPAAVPEPSAAALLFGCCALAGTVAVRRRR